MAVHYPPKFERSEVGGRTVVKDEVLASGLSEHLGRLVPIHGIRVLTLDDGEVVYGCRDCLTEGTRGEIQAHRQTAHGLSLSGRRPADDDGDDGVPGPLPYPRGSSLTLTVYEVLEATKHFEDWERVLGALQDANAQLREQVAELTKALRAKTREHERFKKKIKGVVDPEGGS